MDKYRPQGSIIDRLEQDLKRPHKMQVEQQPVALPDLGTIYIVGKIGDEKEGIEAAHILFEKAETNLALLGFTVINPMKLQHNHGKTWEEYMGECLLHLAPCKAIFLLKEWAKSPGARIEYEVSQLMHKKIIFQ